MIDLQQEIYRAWAGEYRALPKNDILPALEDLAGMLADTADYQALETFRAIAALRPRQPAKPANPADHLIRFVADKGDIRAHIHTPWIVGAHVYATDGHTLCRYAADAIGHMPASEPVALTPARGILPLPRSDADKYHTPPNFEYVIEPALAGATEPATVSDTREHFRTDKKSHIAVRLDGANGAHTWVNEKYLKRALNVPKGHPEPAIRINPKDPHTAVVIDYSTYDGIALIMPVRVNDDK